MDQDNSTTKRRSWKHLSEKERHKIEVLSSQGLSPGKIGAALGRDRRTISRELKIGMVEQETMNKSNNKDAPLYLTEQVYLADTAKLRRAERSSSKGRPLKIGHDHKLANYIADKIKNHGWSPDVILGRIKEEGLQFSTSISTKTLYNYIDKGIFCDISNKDLWVKKDKKKRNYQKIRTVALNNRMGKSITERPVEANERSEIGHWEIDLVVGKQGTKPAIMTLVDRKARKSIYVLIRNKTQEEVLRAMKRARRRVGGDFSEIFKTITSDNGSEFLDSAGLKKAAGCRDVYYAHPYSSWERGSNENGNRMLRRFVPKGTNIGTLTERHLQQIEDWINNYPRKILGYKTANEVFAT
jgi:IS30 family transposase